LKSIARKSLKFKKFNHKIIVIAEISSTKTNILFNKKGKLIDKNSIRDNSNSFQRSKRKRKDS